MVLVDTLTDKKFTVVLPSVEKPCTTVKEWFDKNKKKPEFSIPIWDESLDKVRNEFARQMKDAQVKLPVLISYIYHVAEKMKETLVEDWESYGVKIGKKGDPVTPLSVITVNKVAAPGLDPTAGIENWTADNDLALMIVACGYYRISIATDQGSYKDDISTRIADMATSKKVGDLVPRCGILQGAANCNSLLILLSAIDMFLCKFPKNEFAEIRIGTLVTRYKNCAAVGDISHIQKHLGIDVEKFASFCWLRSVQEELLNLIINDEEVLNTSTSYTPYLAGFALCERSYFSVTSCPNLHLLIHTIGALGGSERSIHSRNTGDANNNAVIRLGTIIAYIFSRGAEYQMRFIKEGTQLPKAAPRIVDPNALPVGQIAAPWFLYLQSRGNQLPNEIKTFFTDCINKLPAPRGGTIGELLKNTTLV